MQKNKICRLCGSLIPEYHTSLVCQSCNLYRKKHPEGVYQLPPDGEIYYAVNGDVICHECGQAHRKLGSHIMKRHKMSQQEYRDKHKLYHNTRLSNKAYIKQMQIYNNENKAVVVDKNLIKKGILTRMTSEYNTPGRKRQGKIKESIIK